MNACAMLLPGSAAIRVIIMHALCSIRLSQAKDIKHVVLLTCFNTDQTKQRNSLLQKLHTTNKANFTHISHGT